MTMPRGLAIALLSLTACGIIPRSEPAATTTTRTSLDLPQTLAAWRALHRPPTRVVTVERAQEGHIDPGAATRTLGVFGLPLIPVALVFGTPPTRFQRATVTSRGRPERVGDFDVDERLFRAWIFDANSAHMIQRFNLPLIHRTYLFDVGRVPVLHDGGIGQVTRVAVLPQGDLAAAAARAIDHPEALWTGVPIDPVAWRARVAEEAVTVLDEESVALLRTWVRNRAVSDDGLGALVDAICQMPSRWRDADGDEARLVRVMRGTVAAMGPDRARFGASAGNCVHVATHRSDGTRR